MHVPRVSAWQVPHPTNHAVGATPDRGLAVVPFHVRPCGKLVVESRSLDLVRLLHAHRDGRWFYRITIDQHGARRIVKMYGFFASGRQYLQNLRTYGILAQSPAQDPSATRCSIATTA